jgi:hypothetical protein
MIVKVLEVLPGNRAIIDTSNLYQVAYEQSGKLFQCWDNEAEARDFVEWNNHAYRNDPTRRMKLVTYGKPVEAACSR